MSDEQPPDALDDDLRDLLSAERRRDEDVSPAVRDRLLERVRERVTVDAPHAPPTPRGALRSVLAAVGGVVVGAGLHAVLSAPPAPRTVTVERVVERVVERQVEVPVVRYVTVVNDGGDTHRDASADRVTAPTRPTRSTDDDDSALVERARVALLRRAPADALAAVEEHARRFPRGQLAEEREALAVQCLAALGRGDDARTRAEVFHRRFPQSALGAVVDAAARR
jgi:hypothetical protein